MREQLPGVGHERLEQPVLGGRQMHASRRRASPGAARGRPSRSPKRRTDGDGSSAPATTQRGAGAGQELLHRERLRHVVVGTRVQRARPCRAARHGPRATMIGTSQNARTRRITSVPSMSGRPRSSRIRSGAISADAQHPFLAGAHGRDLVAVRLEAGAERSPDLRFVVDDEHLVTLLLLDRQLEHDDGSPAGRALRSRSARRARRRPPARSRARDRSRVAPAPRRLDRTPRTRARVRPPGCRRPGPPPAPGSRRGTAAAETCTSPPGGECERGVLEQVRQDLVDLHRIDEHVGEVGADRSNRTATSVSCGRMRATTVCTTISSIAAGLARGHQRARPDLRQVHQVADQPVQPIGLLEHRREQLALLRGIVHAPSSESRLESPPALIDASGVRRSCVTLENSAARSWLVSASSCAPRTRTSSRARSSASAACFAVASSSSRSSS